MTIETKGDWLDFIGSQNDCDVILLGYKVPYIKVYLLNDDKIDISLDDRFTLPGPISREEFERWIPILANAMAVAVGYSSIGEHCTPLNPFKRRVGRLDSMPPPTLSVIDGGKGSGGGPEA